MFIIVGSREKLNRKVSKVICKVTQSLGFRNLSEGFKYRLRHIDKTDFRFEILDNRQNK